MLQIIKNPRLLFIALVCQTVLSHVATAQDASRFNGVWIYYVTELGRNDTTCKKKPDSRLLDYPGIKGIMFDFAWSKIQPAAPGDITSPYFATGGFNWNWLDSILLEAAKRNLYIGILVWTGMDAPGWLYQAPYNIGTCSNTGENACQIKITKTYPDYYNPLYQQFWNNMTDSVIRHINAGPDSDGNDGIALDYRPWVAFYQSCQGSTGDLEAQNGKPFANQPPQCYIDEDDWFRDVVRPTWLFTDTLIQKYKSNLPNIHLLVNNADANSFTSVDLDSGVVFNSLDDFIEEDRLFAFANDSLTQAWRKSNGKGHYYQLNYENLYNAAFESIAGNAAFAPGGNPILTRDECDIHNININNGVNSNNVFAMGAYTLASGLDMWMMGYDVLFENNSVVDPLDTSISDNFINPAIVKVTEFVNRHSQRYAPAAGFAFSALRDGLDAGDFIRFPQAVFNNGDTCTASAKFSRINRNLPNNDSLNLNCGSRRTIAIQSSLAAYGAVQKDAPAAQGKPIRQRNTAIDINDVGWYTMPGNYERFLYQIPVKSESGSDSLNATSQGYWNQYFPDPDSTDTNFNNQLFGRYARGFDLSKKKNVLYFNLDDAFISTQPRCRRPGYTDSGYSGIIHITYNDLSTGAFALAYQAKDIHGNSIMKRLARVSCRNTSNWVTRSFLIPCDAVFENGGPLSSDFLIHSAGRQNVMFALVEFEKKNSINYISQSYTAIDNNAIMVMPNPAQAQCRVQAPSGKIINSLQVYDLTQVSRLNMKTYSKSLSFSVAQLPAGIYMIYTKFTDGSASTTKLLVQH